MLIEKTEVRYFNEVAERQRIENAFVAGQTQTRLLQHLDFIVANDFMSAYAVYKELLAEDQAWYICNTLIVLMQDVEQAEQKLKSLKPDSTQLEISKAVYPKLRRL
jgi:tetrahydromethanopterin S-methyltransferase subunit A